ncbi:MAG: hypothetical protein IKI97_08155 [Clostridia bacterium]|nr:hypothetical protein [Clostridia bacterium]
MMKYDVTITRNGGITVEADSADDAIAKVLDMTTSEIESRAQLTGWEPSDAELLKDGE